MYATFTFKPNIVIEHPILVYRFHNIMQISANSIQNDKDTCIKSCIPYMYICMYVYLYIHINVNKHIIDPA